MKPITRRCAIYTRKSHEEGLEQEFNSLDAQRESCLAYIQSQKSEGWILVKDHYDDGGYTGGNLERPGLQKLMEDIKSGKVHIVVVYKIDRLTRSLMDFAKLVEVFDKHQVTFVSVTQSFNTTTSMGRLTLNVLLSFAQFEREVTGERIRDKIAASKAKGIWMGGHVPIGYDVKERKLLINTAEADIVRYMFQRYLELGCVRLLKEELDNKGIHSKTRIKKDGTEVIGESFSRGGLYKLLSNPIYIGQIRHKDICHPGQHDPIIEQSIWDEVQNQLKEHAPIIKSPMRKTESSILIMKLFDELGEGLTPSHANKKGQRYRYYISRHLTTGIFDKNKIGWRLPAQEIEMTVTESVRQILGDHAGITDALRERGVDVNHIPSLLDAARDISRKLKSEQEAKNIIPDMVRRVDLRPDGIRITISLAPLISAEVKMSEPITITRDIPMQMKRRGIEMRLVIRGAAASRLDPTLIKIIAKAHKWFDELISGKSISTLSSCEKVSDRYIASLLPLAFLAPNIVESIIGGKQPVDLTTEKLLKHIELPMEWADQNRTLRIA